MTDMEMALMANIAVDMQNKDVNDVLDKIRVEIEQLPTNYIEIQRLHSTVERNVVELDAVVRIIKKYKAKSES